jgi:hypothetical protein
MSLKKRFKEWLPFAKICCWANLYASMCPLVACVVATHWLGRDWELLLLVLPAIFAGCAIIFGTASVVYWWFLPQDYDARQVALERARTIAVDMRPQNALLMLVGWVVGQWRYLKWRRNQSSD